MIRWLPWVVAFGAAFVAGALVATLLPADEPPGRGIRRIAWTCPFCGTFVPMGYEHGCKGDGSNPWVRPGPQDAAA